MQQQPRLPLWFLIANWGLIAAAFFLGQLLGGWSYLPEEQREELEIVYREIMESHIEPPDGHELLEQAMEKMVASLDPYSRYIPPQDAPAYDENNTGSYQGIGIGLLTGVKDSVVLGCPSEHGPAERAGLLPGDVLVAVDGKPLDTAEMRSKASELVRGPADTDVRLTITRDGQQQEVVVRRAEVQTPCTNWIQFVDAEQGLGYLHLSDFHPTAQKQVLAAIDRLLAERPLKGLILDLRFDGGGNLDACLGIARMFLKDGVIATQRRRNGVIAETYLADPQLCRFPDLPLVVLVNGGSASASEVLSGALQDHGRAAVVGQRTHGKAYVNTVYTWKNHDFRLKLTTGTYRTPNGRNIERSYRTSSQDADRDAGGIPPDVVAEVDKNQALAIHSLLATRQPPARYAARFAEVLQRYQLPAVAPPNTDADPQLAAAVATLRERVEAAAAPK